MTELRHDVATSAATRFAPLMRSSRAHVRRTPLLEAASPRRWRAAVSLKLEFLQHTGSFKPRGAFNNLLTRQRAAGRLRDGVRRQSRRGGRLCRGQARRQRASSCRRSPRR